MVHGMSPPPDFSLNQGKRMSYSRLQYLKAAGALGAMALFPGLPCAFAAEGKLKASADAILKCALV